MTPRLEQKPQDDPPDLGAATRLHQARAARAIALREALAEADAAEHAVRETGQPLEVPGLEPAPEAPRPTEPDLVAALHDYARALADWGRLRTAWLEITPLVEKMEAVWEGVAANVLVTDDGSPLGLLPETTADNPVEERIAAWRAWASDSPATIDALARLLAGAEESRERHQTLTREHPDVPLPAPPTLILPAGTPAALRVAARRLEPALAAWGEQVDRVMEIHSAVVAYREAAQALHAQTPHDPDRVALAHPALVDPFGTAVSADATRALVLNLRAVTTELVAVRESTRAAEGFLAERPVKVDEAEADAGYFEILAASPRLAPQARRLHADLAAWRTAHAEWRERVERAREIRRHRHKAETALIALYRSTPHDPDGILATELVAEASYAASATAAATRTVTEALAALVAAAEEATRLTAEREEKETAARSSVDPAGRSRAARILQAFPLIEPAGHAAFPAAVRAWKDALLERDAALERAARCGEITKRLHAAFKEHAALVEAWPHRAVARPAVPAETVELASSLADQNDDESLAALETAWQAAVAEERRAYDEVAGLVLELEAGLARARNLLAEHPAAYRWHAALEESARAEDLTPAEFKDHHERSRELIARLEGASGTLAEVTTSGEALDARIRALAVEHPHPEWRRDARDAFYDMDQKRIEAIRTGVAQRHEAILDQESRRLAHHRRRALDRQSELAALEEGGVPAAIAQGVVDLAGMAVDALGEAPAETQAAPAETSRNRLQAFLAAWRELESGLTGVKNLYAAELAHLEQATLRLGEGAAAARARIEDEIQRARDALARADFAAVVRARARIHSLLTHAVYRDEMDVRTLRRLASDLLIENERVVEPEVVH